jgi:hypothetical protein
VSGGAWDVAQSAVISPFKTNRNALGFTPLEEQLPVFFRVDARFYWRRYFSDRRNSTLGFELQNATLRQNVAYRYLEIVNRQVETKYQLGLIPNISWRMEF